MPEYLEGLEIIDWFIFGMSDYVVLGSLSYYLFKTGKVKHKILLIIFTAMIFPLSKLGIGMATQYPIPMADFIKTGGVIPLKKLDYDDTGYLTRKETEKLEIALVGSMATIPIWYTYYYFKTRYRAQFDSSFAVKYKNKILKEECDRHVRKCSFYLNFLTKQKNYKEYSRTVEGLIDWGWGSKDCGEMSFAVRELIDNLYREEARNITKHFCLRQICPKECEWWSIYFKERDFPQ